MSNALYCLLKTDRIPTRDQWQTAIDKLSLKLQLQLGLEDLAAHEGYLPCKWKENEHEVGFEYDTEPETGGRTTIALRWGGCMNDSAAASIAAYALMKDFGAEVAYEDEPYEDLEALMAEVTGGIESALAEAAGPGPTSAPKKGFLKRLFGK